MKIAVVSIVEPYVTNLLEKTLKDDWKLVFASSGDEALKYAKKLKPDIVITDVLLPGMNGLHLFQRLKEDPETSTIPVLFLTPYMVKERIFSLGGKHFVALPHRKEEFEEFINTVIKEHINNAVG